MGNYRTCGGQADFASGRCVRCGTLCDSGAICQVLVPVLEQTYGYDPRPQRMVSEPRLAALEAVAETGSRLWKVDPDRVNDMAWRDAWDAFGAALARLEEAGTC